MKKRHMDNRDSIAALLETLKTERSRLEACGLPIADLAAYDALCQQAARALAALRRGNRLLTAAADAMKAFAQRLSALEGCGGLRAAARDHEDRP